MTDYDAVDLFAGPGGWDVAAERLGLRVVGVEYDAAACATRRAAGHATVEASVLDVDPLDYVGVRGLIASPPCQTFSRAGKGSGRAQLDLMHRAIARLAAGEWPAEEIEATHDDRTALVLEPLRWALLLRPEWIALEQVEGVLPLWEEYAVALCAEGYSVATGMLHAEEYGVPQTRKRAVLLASRTRKVALPAPTHTRYRKGKPRQVLGLLPWVSMAEALGWTEDAVVGFARRADTDDVVTIDGVDYRARDLRPTTEPAQAVTEKSRSWTLRTPAMDRAYDRSRPRTLDEPAHTIATGHAAAQLTWQPPEDRQAGLGGTVVKADVADRKPWCEERPATTLATRDLVADPGTNANRYNGATKSRNDGVRVTVAEAAVLQSFPADYPWQGSKTKQHQQIGNAIPPLMAQAVLQVLAEQERHYDPHAYDPRTSDAPWLDDHGVI